MRRVFLRILAILLCQGCALGTFSFDKSGAEANGDVDLQCNGDATLEITDAAGSLLNGKVLARGTLKPVKIPEGVPPYDVLSDYGSFQGTSIRTSARTSSSGTTTSVVRPAARISTGTGTSTEYDFEFLPDNLPTSDETDVTFRVVDAKGKCGTVSLKVAQSASIDTSFGSSGLVTIDFSAQDDALFDVVFDADHQWLIALGNKDSEAYSMVKAVDTSGTPIATGSFDLGDSEWMRSILLDPNDTDKFYISGAIDNGSNNVGYLMRLQCMNCASSPYFDIDWGWGSGGVSGPNPVSTGSQEGFMEALTFGSNLLVPHFDSSNFFVQTLYDSAGIFDATTLPSGPFSYASTVTGFHAFSSAVDPTGKVLTVGSTSGTVKLVEATLGSPGSISVLSDRSLTSFGIGFLSVHKVKRLANGRIFAVGNDASGGVFIGLYENPSAATNPGALLSSYVTTALGGSPIDLSSTLETAVDFVEDDAGALFVVGSYLDGVYRKGYIAKFVINENDELELDPSFGDGGGHFDANGKSLDGSGYHYLDLANTHTDITSITRDSIGRLIVGGRGKNTTSNDDWVIYRLYP